MVDVDHQDQVDRPLREAGVGLGAADRLDVGHPGGAGVLAEHAEHLGLDVGGIDDALGADLAGQPDAVITGPAPTLATVAPVGIFRALSIASGCSSSIRVSRKSHSAPCQDITSAIGRPM